MSVYKVPQDVEAEDKLLGPLSLKQFIFAIITVICLYLVYALGRINLFLIIIPMPAALLFGVLSLPIKKDQPLEIYLVARLRFLFKPRRRLWDQDGVMETVRITAPQFIDTHVGKNVSQSDVKSSLKNLAKIMDTRGWSAKNAAIQEGGELVFSDSDRLIMPQAGPQYSEIHDADDIMDAGNNPVAQRLGDLETESTQQVKAAAIQQMKAAAQPAPVATAPAPQPQAYYQPQPVTPQPQYSAAYNPYPQMRQQVISPAGTPPQSPPPAPLPPAQTQTTNTMEPQETPVILKELSQNNDRSVQSLANEAEKTLKDNETISLH